MEQRPLRLGDILDDYCPRERRVTNHAIVAMIEEDVRQTRCTTCDAEHVYKGGKAPRRRKKETAAALYEEVLAGMPDVEAAPILTVPVSPVVIPTPRIEPEPRPVITEPIASAPAPVDRAAAADEVPAPDAPPVVEEGPVHRPLIRATLPRPEGQKEVRQAADFTMRQPIGRGHFRGDGRPKMRGPGHGGSGSGSGNGNGNGNRAHGGGGQRFSGPRSGGQSGRGPAGRGGATGGGFRSSQPRQGGGGRKRSR
jgi:hypothetical protein